MRKFFTLIVALCLLATGDIFAQQLRAFSGAEGYGAYVSGGRGGRVVYVTHTGDVESPDSALYQGSFRAALRTSGSDPITIVFLCGGTIMLQPTMGNRLHELKIPRSNITIAGQTGLGDGICIGGHGMQFSGDNVMIRHMRFRPGDTMVQNNPALSFANGGTFMLDHCSFSWSVEENVNIDDIEGVSMQWCINSESLYNAGHDKGSRSYAATIGGNAASYHHNLLAHHVTRMPRANATSKPVTKMFDYRNNVHYNWQKRNSFYGGEVEAPLPCMTQNNLINNYYKPGNFTNYNDSDNSYFCAPSGGRTNIVGSNPWIYGHGKWWLEGNIMEGDSAKTANNFLGLYAGNKNEPYEYQGDKYNASKIFTIPTAYAVTTTSAEDAYEQVLANAGATLPKRDGIDARVVNEVITKTSPQHGAFNNHRLTGIIDSHKDTKPAADSLNAYWNAWNSYYRNVTLVGAPDTFEVKTLTAEGWKTAVIKMSRVVDTDGDGIPDWWETANGLRPDLPGDANGNHFSRYTYLEVYLNSFPHDDAPADEVISTWEEPALCDTCNVNTGIVKGEAQPYLRVYPNPVATNFSIETVLEPKAVEIYSLSGQRVASFPASAYSSYSVALLHRGSYVVKVLFTNGKFATQRIVK